MNVEDVHSSGHSPVSQIATHILCIMSSTLLSSCFKPFCWDLIRTCGFATCCLTYDTTRATSERSGRGSCSQHSCSIPLPYSSWYKCSQYPFHLCDIRVASVKFSPVADWIHCRRGWNFRVIDLTIWKSCLEFTFEFAASNSTHMPSSCCCLSTLSILCTSAFSS